VTTSLAIVVVNWNAAEALRLCLRSLRCQEDTAFELVVVDNGSGDGSSEVVHDEFPAARLVPTGANLGFAAACNLGIRASTGDWVLTLNNDTEVAPGLVGRLREAAAAAAADVGMLQPRLVLRGRGRLNSTGVLVHRDGTADDRDFDAPLGARPSPDEVMCVTAGAGLYRRAMLEATRLPSGYFDPGFFMYFEDVDLGWRSRLAGWRAQYVPTASVEHVFQGSSRRHGPHFVTIQCKRNRLRTLLKNASLRMIVRTLPRTAGDLLWLLRHDGGRALADWLDAVRDGAGQRAHVNRIASGTRRALERRWILPR